MFMCVWMEVGACANASARCGGGDNKMATKQTTIFVQSSAAVADDDDDPTIATTTTTTACASVFAQASSARRPFCQSDPDEMMRASCERTLVLTQSSLSLRGLFHWDDDVEYVARVVCFLWNSLLMRIELRLCACRNTRTHTKCEKGRYFAHKVVECLHTLYRNGVQNKSILYCTYIYFCCKCK